MNILNRFMILALSLGLVVGSVEASRGTVKGQDEQDFYAKLILSNFNKKLSDTSQEKLKEIIEIRKTGTGAVYMNEHEELMSFQIELPLLVNNTDLIQLYYLFFGLVNCTDTINPLLKALNDCNKVFKDNTDAKRVKGYGRLYMQILLGKPAKKALEIGIFNSSLDKARVQLLYNTFYDIPSLITLNDGTLKTDLFTLKDLETFRDAARAIENNPLSYGTMIKSAVKVNSTVGLLAGTGLAYAAYKNQDFVTDFVKAVTPFATRMAEGIWSGVVNFGTTLANFGSSSPA